MRSQRIPQVKRSVKTASHGSTEKSHELRQEAGDMDSGWNPFLRCWSASMSCGWVLESATVMR